MQQQKQFELLVQEYLETRGLELEDLATESLQRPPDERTVISWDKPRPAASHRVKRQCQFMGGCQDEVEDEGHWFCPAHLAFMRGDTHWSGSAVDEIDLEIAGAALPGTWEAN